MIVKYWATGTFYIKRYVIFIKAANNFVKEKKYELKQYISSLLLPQNKNLNSLNHVNMQTPTI